MSMDLMRRLRAADPAARLDLRPDGAMREAIMTTHVTTEHEAKSARARRVRRGVLAGGLATVLVGGGVAYAAVVNDWYRGGGGHDGLTCLTRWDGPEGERSGGPVLTGDLVADCQRYQAETGLPAIEDAIAFRHLGVLYVAPRGEVPTEATLVAPEGDDLAVQELESSLEDWVDGLGAQCLDETAAVVAARAELDRLGLDDWSVRTEAREPARTAAGQVPDPAAAGGCADVSYAYDTADDAETVDRSLPYPVAEPAGSEPAGPEPTGPEASTPTADAGPVPTTTPVPWPYGQVPRTLAVRPDGRASHDSLREHVVPFVYDLRDALREQIADACVDLGEAERIVAEAIGEEHHWPTVVIEEPQAACTRVDLVVGGSLQVSLRGPRG